MPATTPIRIVIGPAGEADSPVPPSPTFLLARTIRLDELSSADSPPSWRLSGRTGVQPALLSAAQSAHLAASLAALPARGLSAEVRSFDGVQYELVVLQPGEPLVFRWQNEDWRHDPKSPHAEWERVAALADLACSLAGGEEGIA